MTRSQLDKLKKCYAENDYEVADDLRIWAMISTICTL